MKHTRLYPFQAEGVRRIRQFGGRALLADEVGLGKTIQSLYYAWKYLPDEPPGPVVCVVPPHLRINWKREAQKHLGLRAEILYGERVPPDKLRPRDPNQIYVVGNNTLVPPLWAARTRPPEDSWVVFLRNLNPRLVIGDEGHAFKNPQAARTRAFKWLCRGVERVLILTGTPLPNKPVDLWSLVNILRPKLFPSRFDFCTEYAHATHHWYGWQFRGARNLEKLHKILLENVMIRRRKCDVLSQLPTVTHSVIPIEIDQAEYRRAEEDYLGWLEAEHPQMAKRAAQAADLSRLTGLKRLAARLKVDSVIRWVEGLLEESEGKLLLGALHYTVTEPIVAAFGASAVLVDGRMTDTEKQSAFDRFNLDRRTRLLVGNLDAAGTGWNCRATSDAALAELPWRPGDVAQFCGRIHGLERGLPGTAAHIRFLVAVGTVEEDLCRALQTKEVWARTAVDGVSGTGDLNIYDQVKAMIRKRTGKPVNFGG